MPEKQAIVAIIQVQDYRGHKILGEQWPAFVSSLRDSLQKSGFEDQNRASGFLIFSYSHPVTALSSIVASIAAVKKSVGWPDPNLKAPVRTLLHLQKKMARATFEAELVSGFRDDLQDEAIYVSRGLRRQWERLMTGYDGIPIALEELDLEIFKVNISDYSKLRQKKLLAHRDLALSGTHPECFYCGMTTHHPAACPSKYLQVDNHATEQVGYIPFPLLNSLYKDIFANEKSLAGTVAAGVEIGELRKNQLLQLFMAYFDIYLIYQVRFLRHCAFSTISGWENQPAFGRIKIDSHNLNMAIDCLRVGRLEQAGNLLLEETRRPEGKPFFGTIGLAFLALDVGKMREMGLYLDRAANLAETEKERIYVKLLQARYYGLQDDPLKAENALSGIPPLNRDCLAARYAKIQITVRSGAGERVLKPLTKLVEGSQDFFMAALMDPVFLPVQAQVEDLLITELQARTQNAGENLTLAQNELKNLAAWLPADDPSLIENQEILTNLENQLARGGYYDMIDVAARSMALYYTCRRLKDSMRSSLKKRIDAAVASWRRFTGFWQDFRYQSLLGKSFMATQEALRGHLDAVETMVVGHKGEVYQDALQKVNAVEDGIDDMHKVYRKMLWLRNLVDAVKIFAVKLVITEVLLVTAGLAFFTVYIMQFPEPSFGGGTDILRDPFYQERIFWMAVLLVAPLLSLLLTFISVFRRAAR